MTPKTIQIQTTLQRERRLRVAYNKSQGDPSRRVAAIRISGVYLEDLGFKAGGYMDLYINDDRSITLRPVHDDEDLAQDLRQDDVGEVTQGEDLENE